MTPKKIDVRSLGAQQDECPPGQNGGLRSALPERVHNTMRPILALLAVAIATNPLAARAQVSAFPYTENFETDNGGYLTGGSNSSWDWGVPFDNYIMAAGQGDRCWVTNLTGSPLSSSQGYLQSPEFDFTGFTEDPTLQFLHSYEWDNSDEGWIQVSFDGGPYTKLVADPAATSLNWYNDTFNEWWDGNSGGSGQWELVRHPITGAAGKKATLRWLASTGFPIEDGWAVDQVQVFNDLVDLQAFSIGVPEGGPGLEMESISMSMRNIGSAPTTQFDVRIDVSGPQSSTSIETIQATIAPLQVGVFQLQTPVDLSAEGLYTITVTVQAPGDANPGNDSISGEVRNEKVVTSFPFLEDFESGPSGFYAEGQNSTWELGSPQSDFIFGTGSGSNAWVTNLTGDAALSEVSYLQTPEFDFSSLQKDPFLEFNHIFQVFSNGDCWVDYSVNGGSYTRLGTADSPASLNWYSGFGFPITWDGSSGDAGVWRTARHIVPGAAGSRVAFRIYLQASTSTFSGIGDGVGVDDVRVYEAPLGNGQAPLPDEALLDINDAQEILGFGVTDLQPGPYFATASPESGFALQVQGPALQPIVLFMGKLSVGTAFVPEVGQVDIEQVQIFASGLLPGGFNPFFVTGLDGSFELSFSVPNTLVGGGSTFQALTLDSLGLPKVSNAVQVQFVP